MLQEIVTITNIQHLTKEIVELSFKSDYISENTKPGQFINIRVDEHFPLLRRPFSVYNIEKNIVSIAFTIVGLGSSVLAKKKIGNTLDVLGSCGNSFLDFVDGDFATAIIIAGGIGVAPFVTLTKTLSGKKKIKTYLGGRTKELLVKKGLEQILVATDDGTEGFKGTVLDLMKNDFSRNEYEKMRFFICGPSRMIKAVAEFAQELQIDCYASLETGMACGIGLCQGCNIEVVGQEKKYKLVCKDGTIFETKTVNFL